MYSHIVEENDRIYKEMRIMDDRIAEMEAELARMRELYEKNKNPGTQQQDAPETQQENPPKDNKKIPPGNKLKPGTGTIETDFSY